MRFVWILTISFSVFAEVEPPNYNFSLDALQPFYPGEVLEATGGVPAVLRLFHAPAEACRLPKFRSAI